MSELKNISTITKLVQYILYAYIIIVGIWIVFGVMEYSLLLDFQNGIYTSEELIMAAADKNDQRQNIISGLYLIIFLISAILIMRWTYVANYNVHQLGAQNMKFSPRWSIGYYFIPILNLWKPYQAMKEIWKTSKSPLSWESATASSVLSLWWLLWIISSIMGRVIFNMSKSTNELTELLNLNIITQISNMLDIVLAIVTLAVINNIYRMQSQHLESKGKINLLK